jgi:hypothetical protein
MKQQNDTQVDLDLLLFYFFVSLGSFILYMTKHPLFSALKDRSVIFKAVISAYSFDLIMFLVVLIPYLLIILYLIFNKVVYKKKIKDNIIVVLFFPILSFFTKGMSLIQIYVNYSIIEILKNNFAFVIFLFMGPVIIIMHKFIVYIRFKRSRSIN